MAEEQKNLDLDNVTEEQAADLTEQEADEALRRMSRPPEEPKELPQEPPPPEKPTEEPKAGEAAAEEVKPAEEEKPEEQPPDEGELHIKELELQLEESQQERDKFRMLVGSQGNQIGDLRKQIDTLTKLQQMPVSRQPTEGQETWQTETEAPVTRQPVSTGIPPTSIYEERLARMEEAERTRELEAAYDSFLQDNSEVLPKDQAERGKIMDRMAPIVQAEIKEYAGLNLGGPQVRRLARSVLDTAFTRVRREDIRQLRSEALKRKAEQVPKHRQVKQQATISGSGSAAGSKPKTKPVEDWTEEEADRWLKQQFGDGHSRRRRV